MVALAVEPYQPPHIMRTKKQIQDDGSRKDILSLEVLLDIREILLKETKKKRKNV
tara:strand:+ start:4861 stop:5025 length:165 start_codon:yes stop_codon:yes gene_type:complete